LTSIAEIESISGGSNHLGAFLGSSIVELPDRKLEAFKLDADANYIKTMGLDILDGRGFRENYESDKSAIIINETFAKNLNWETPIGKSFRYDSINYTVAGVAKDFHYYSFWTEIEPVFIRLEDKDYRYLAARVNDEDNIISVFEEVESTWGKLYPELPFRGDYQTQLYADYFTNVNGHKGIMVSVAVIAMILSCFGLYGLVSLNVAGRRKEFSVRKVLGARIVSIASAVSSHFLVFLSAALIVGAPLSYYLIALLLDVIYTYHMPMSILPVMIAVGLIILTVLVTVSTHITRVNTMNPVEGLRMD